MRNQRIAMAAILIALGMNTACKGDGGPTGMSRASETDLEGTWELTGTESSGLDNRGGRACEIEVFVSLMQTGSNLKGRQFSGTRSCISTTGIGNPFTVNASTVDALPNTSVQGSVSGNQIELVLDLGKGPSSHRGIVTAEDRIEGADDGFSWSARRVSATTPVAPETVSPTAPSGLTATTDGALLEAILRWQDNSDNETGFAVVESCNGAEFSVLAVLDANSTSVRISGFSIGDVCDYVVASFLRMGDEILLSDFSNLVRVRF